MIDEGSSKVSQVWRMQKDKTRTLVGEELVILPPNVESIHPESKS